MRKIHKHCYSRFEIIPNQENINELWKGSDPDERKFAQKLDESNELADELLELEQLAIPLGHAGSVLQRRLASKQQFQHDFLEELVKSEIDNQEIKEAAFRELNSLKSWFDENFLTTISEPGKILD